MDLRQQKAIEIADKFRITEAHGRWTIPSQTGPGTHTVVFQDHIGKCTCADFEERRQHCKHILAVQILKERAGEIPGTESVIADDEPVKRPTYPQNWPAYNRAQTSEQDVFQALLFDLCQRIEQPRKVTRGRPPLPLSEMVFSVAYKVYSTFSGRRFMSDLRSARDRGFLTKTPHYNSIFNYLESPELTPILKDLIVESSLPLKSVEVDFAADSSGFSVSRFERWFDHKHGSEHFQREWVKLHIMCGVKTNVITAVEIRGKHANDAPLMGDLLATTARNFRMSEVSADKGYMSAENVRKIARHKAKPFIPLKSNQGDNPRLNPSLAFREMYHYFMFRREDFLRHYHKRSNVETTFSMMKRKFGDFVRSKSDVAMINEVLCKVLCHNIVVLIHEMCALGIEPNFCAEIPRA